MKVPGNAVFAIPVASAAVPSSPPPPTKRQRSITGGVIQVHSSPDALAVDMVTVPRAEQLAASKYMLLGALMMMVVNTGIGFIPRHPHVPAVATLGGNTTTTAPATPSTLPQHHSHSAATGDAPLSSVSSVNMPATECPPCPPCITANNSTTQAPSESVPATVTGTMVDDPAMLIGQPISHSKKTTMLSGFQDKFSTSAALLSCASCGKRHFTSNSRHDFPLVNLDELNVLSLNQSSVDHYHSVPVAYRKALSVVEHGERHLHLHQQFTRTLLLRNGTKLRSAQLCRRCFEAVAVGEVPAFSLAAGFRFGDAERIGLPKLSDLEAILLGMGRTHLTTLKLSTTGGHTPAFAIKGHVISFPHDAPQQAAAAFPDISGATRHFCVKFTGPSQHAEEALRRALHIESLLARPEVIYAWLRALKVLNPVYKHVVIDESPAMTEKIRRLPGELLAAAEVISDPGIVAIDRAAGSDVAGIRTIPTVAVDNTSHTGTSCDQFASASAASVGLEQPARQHDPVIVDHVLLMPSSSMQADGLSLRQHTFQALRDVAAGSTATSTSGGRTVASPFGGSDDDEYDAELEESGDSDSWSTCGSDSDVSHARKLLKTIDIDDVDSIASDTDNFWDSASGSGTDSAASVHYNPPMAVDPTVSPEDVDIMAPSPLFPNSSFSMSSSPSTPFSSSSDSSLFSSSPSLSSSPLQWSSSQTSDASFHYSDLNSTGVFQCTLVFVSLCFFCCNFTPCDALLQCVLNPTRRLRLWRPCAPIGLTWK